MGQPGGSRGGELLQSVMEAGLGLAGAFLKALESRRLCSALGLLHDSLHGPALQRQVGLWDLLSLAQ